MIQQYSKSSLYHFSARPKMTESADCHKLTPMIPALSEKADELNLYQQCLCYISYSPLSRSRREASIKLQFCALVSPREVCEYLNSNHCLIPSTKPSITNRFHHWMTKKNFCLKFILKWFLFIMSDYDHNVLQLKDEEKKQLSKNALTFRNKTRTYHFVF